MYNRYLQGDHSAYTRVEQEEKRTSSPPPPPPNHGQKNNSSPLSGIQNLLNLGGKNEHGESFLRRILSRFHLEDVDTGDLILLILLFFLLEEKADDELLIALGLLLIL